MNKVFFSFAALALSFAGLPAQAGTVNFDSGSAKVQSVPAAKQKQHHKKKVWVPAHRSQGRLVKGQYIWR